MKVLDIDSVSDLSIFDKIVFYIRKSLYKRQTIKKFNKEIMDKIGYHELKIYVSWIEPDCYSILSGNHKTAADYGYKEGIDEISKKYALKHSSLHSGYFEIKTKQYKVYKIDCVYQRGQWFLQSSEYYYQLLQQGRAWSQDISSKAWKFRMAFAWTMEQGRILKDSIAWVCADV